MYELVKCRCLGEKQPLVLAGAWQWCFVVSGISGLYFYPQCHVHSPVVPGQWDRLLKEQRQCLDMTCKVHALLRNAYREGPVAKGRKGALPESLVATGWADGPLLHTVFPVPCQRVVLPILLHSLSRGSHLDEHFCLQSALICTSYHRRRGFIG